MVNPTGGKIRSDSMGDGHYGSRRGRRTHKGVDYLCTPGQKVRSPISGILVRTASPYADDQNYTGVYIEGDNIAIKMFYCKPTVPIGTKIKAGEAFAIAQDISTKYGEEMKPHVHLEIASMNPLMVREI